MPTIGHGTEICTSTTRPSTAAEGLMIYETDTNKVLVNSSATSTPSWVEIHDLDNLGAMSTAELNRPMCLLDRSTSQTISNVTGTAITFSSETVDTDTMHDNSTNNSRITIKTAGIYSFFGTLNWATGGTGQYRLVSIVKNNGDAEIAFTNTNGTYDQRLSVSAIHKCAVNDYFRLWAYQDSGGNKGLSGFPYTATFGAVWLGSD